MRPVIQVSGVRKTYGQMVAIDEVSFEVSEGEIFGLIGPNGAGKTTTMECIEGLRRPERGTISVLGLDPIRHVYELSGPHRGSTSTGTTAEADQSVGGRRPLGFALPEKSDRRGTVTRTTWSDREAQRLVHEPLGRPEAAALYRSSVDQRSRGRVSR